MARISFEGREVETFEVEKLQAPSNRRVTRPLNDAQAVQFANPAGDEYVAYVCSAHALGLRPGTAGLYEHDGVSEPVTITAVTAAAGRPMGTMMVSTGMFTMLAGALAGTLIEPGAGTVLGAAAALIGTIGVGMPLAALIGGLVPGEGGESGG